jgi:hypothetical protein
LSLNSDTLIWYFGDDLKAATSQDSLKHTYEMPGTYRPKLVAYNIVPHLYEACADTFPEAGEDVIMEETDDTYPIVVDKAQIDGQDGTGMNNVITIPPDGVNDYFRFTGDVSMTDFEIMIYNRYGGRVYHYKGNIRDWSGWDGSDDGTSRFVNTGVYYYVVKEINVFPSEEGLKPKLVFEEEADKNDPDFVGTNNVMRGFIHVFNNP